MSGKKVPYRLGDKPSPNYFIYASVNYKDAGDGTLWLKAVLIDANHYANDVEASFAIKTAIGKEFGSTEPDYITRALIQPQYRAVGQEVMIIPVSQKVFDRHKSAIDKCNQHLEPRKKGVSTNE